MSECLSVIPGIIGNPASAERQQWEHIGDVAGIIKDAIGCALCFLMAVPGMAYQCKPGWLMTCSVSLFSYVCQISASEMSFLSLKELGYTECVSMFATSVYERETYLYTRKIW